ncbi:hypothetical protein ABDZ57_15570 [Aeromonas veronii]|uniref:hypothetical protein n=1 Tax=Aeromonas veronii TaxID=654 RepID=UPI0031FBB5A2
MNNKALWQLTADGVSQIIASRKEFEIDSPSESALNKEFLFDEFLNKEHRAIAVTIIRTAAPRVIKRHSFQLSSTTHSVDDLEDKVYIVRLDKE